MLKMKRGMWLLLVIPILLLVLLVVFYWGFFSANQFWLVASIVMAVVWLLFVGLVVNIDRQVDENPYYTEMVMRKRDEVRELRKAYAHTHRAG